jgi:hypothetical protein
MFINKILHLKDNKLFTTSKFFFFDKDSHFLILKGMKILIQFYNDKQKLIECFKLFKHCADQFNNHEYLWKISAYYYNGIGTKKD